MFDLVLIKVFLVQPVRDIIVDRKGIEQRSFLKHHPDILADAHQLDVVEIGNVLAFDEHLARVGL